MFEVTPKTCPFCNKQMGNVCECGAYRVTPETSHLKLKDQPYMKKRGMKK